jgi:GT2 family glycosyltransferase
VRPFPLVYTSNAEGGCDYSGIAGSVTGFEGQPLNGYIVWITGEEIDSRLTSGSDNTYGAGGFNLQVGTSAAVRAYAAQLLAPDGVTPLSEPFTFLSREACEFNIALVRFVQIRELP